MLRNAPHPASKGHCFAPIPYTVGSLSQKLRVFHDDQPYLALQSPISSSTIKSLLPCPPTSPSKRARFRLRSPRLSFSLENVVRNSPLGRLSTRLHRRLAKRREASPTVWICMYFVLNLCLTLYNKYVLIRFPFPYTLTALHALCGTAGTFIMFTLELTSEPAIPNLRFREMMVLVLFSMLYTVNILVSNASLKLVTVPFHQVVRGSTPLFTVFLSAMLFRKRCSREKVFSLMPVIAGVALATYGDYYYTPFGFLITIFGTLLAALKTILTNFFLRAPTLPVSITNSDSSSSTSSNISPSPSSASRLDKVPAIFQHLGQSDPQTRLTTARPWLSVPSLSLTPLQLLYIMSPLAFVQTTVMAHFTGELDAVNRHLSGATGALHGMPNSPKIWLLLNGLLAFGLNVVSFNSNKRIGPLGMTVAANVKQVLTVLCAVGIFNLTITFTNGLGIILTLFGGAWYAYVEVREKQQIKRSG
ncbi:triose-phosphate transporter family-domain-containing protein [Coprinopsis sp. MPI-PUGE-AT-0042]|nr:triose-phosphate transporter family-domain-containing protein [Coprinopsis sp. MPI-PUGE-AT-0042]